MNEPQNLMDGILNEIERVSSIRTQYQDPELKGAGMMSAGLMTLNIHAAKEAISSGDVVEMLRQYEELKTWTL